MEYPDTKFVDISEIDDSLILDLFGPFVTAQSSTLISGLEAECRIVKVANKCVPIVAIGEGDCRAYITSINSNYTGYAIDYVMKQNWWMIVALVPFLKFLWWVGRESKVDHVVYVNNWLMATGPWLALSSQERKAIMLLLQKTYPGKAIVFKHCTKSYVNDLDFSDKKTGLAVFNRIVYELNPKHFLTGKIPRRYKQDLKLLRSAPYEHKDNATLEASDISDVKRLYELLYFSKYSHLSTPYTVKWFKEVLASKSFSVNLVIDEGRTVCFSSYFVNQHQLIASIIGHETDESLSKGYYRAGFIKLVNASLSYNKPINMSSSQGEFKTTRGCEPIEEYEYISTQGCSVGQKFWFKIIGSLYNSIGLRLYKSLGI